MRARTWACQITGALSAHSAKAHMNIEWALLLTSIPTTALHITLSECDFIMIIQCFLDALIITFHISRQAAVPTAPDIIRESIDAAIDLGTFFIHHLVLIYFWYCCCFCLHQWFLRNHSHNTHTPKNALEPP